MRQVVEDGVRSGSLASERGRLRAPDLDADADDVVDQYVRGLARRFRASVGYSLSSRLEGKAREPPWQPPDASRCDGGLPSTSAGAYCVCRASLPVCDLQHRRLVIGVWLLVLSPRRSRRGSAEHWRATSVMVKLGETAVSPPKRRRRAMRFR
jgi:hypothetical protein